MKETLELLKSKGLLKGAVKGKASRGKGPNAGDRQTDKGRKYEI